MATKRFLRTSIDWAAFAERVPENQKPKFQQFKAKVDGYVKNLMSYPEKPPAIDWSLYKARISPALVDDFQKKYGALKVAYPADKVSPEIDEQEKRMKKNQEQFNELSELRIKCHQKSLEWWHNMMAFDQMTYDDFRDYFPDEAFDPINKPNFYPYDEPPRKVFPYLEKKEHH